MLRDVVLHLQNEQPLLADLPNEPSPSDYCLICTNLRTMNGKPPIFVESGDSTFIFPMQTVRFVEIRAAAAADRGEPETVPQPQAAPHPAPKRLKSGKPAPGLAGPEPRAQMALEDDYDASLERLAWVSGNADAPPPEPSKAAGDAGPADPDLDGDDFLRRVREI